MKISEISEVINECIANKSVVHIIRRNAGTHPIDCIPLALGDKFLLVQYLNDFQLDGYKIIRLKDISFVRVGEFERFYEHILKSEDIYDEIIVPLIPDLGNIKNIIKEFKYTGKTLIIKCENKEEGKSYIGRINYFNTKSFSFLCLNSIGEWNGESSQMAYNEISSIRFDDRYTKIISKYLGKDLSQGRYII